VETTVDLRRLDRGELVRVAEIDRSERIEILYEQDGERLVERHGHWDATAWETEGDGDHSVAAKVLELHGYVDAGGIALGAFVDTRLVGIGVVVPRLEPGIAQLAFLHVSAPWRATGIGGRLVAQLEGIARQAGDEEMVVGDTVGQHRGLLPRSGLRAHAPSVGTALRSGTRRRTHAQAARSLTRSR
jgi:GNAT superfamily N-acetyltransferase